MQVTNNQKHFEQIMFLKLHILSIILIGNIPHSARPPSFNFTGARLTFVTKLHRNEYAGRRKNFQEELRFFRSSVRNNYELTSLNSSKGERIARKRLIESVLMKERLSYRMYRY